MGFMDGLEPIRDGFKENKRLQKLRRPSKAVHPVAAGALRSAVDNVFNADEGERNSELFKAAAWVAGFFPEGYLDEDDARSKLFDAAVYIGLSREEVDRTIDSGFDRGRSSPVDISEAEKADQDSYYDKLKQATLTAAMLDNLPRPEPLVSDTLFRNTVAFLVGAPGNGKSFVAVDLAGCVSSGQPWNGREVQGGTVLYGVFEGATGIRQRVHGWQFHNEKQMSRVAFFAPEVVSIRPPQLSQGMTWDAFVKYAAKDIRPDLIVLDTFNRMSIGLNENAAEEMSAAMAQLDRLKTATGACVLVVHHTRKLEAGAEGVRLDDMRGSGSLAGAADTVLAVTKDESIVTVHCVKQKDVEAFEPYSLELIPSPDRYNKALSHSVVDTKDLQVEKILRRWHEAFGNEQVSATHLEKARVVDASTFIRLRKHMVDIGAIAEMGNGTRKTYRINED